ncbi:MAG: sigma-70 family RNA polymerase sigma factor [Deltaproteobacteria bacterium]|nr:sigma-70 family RNA polymerase sigma factor [Deltaproteobacteria bacterium]
MTDNPILLTDLQLVHNALKDRKSEDVLLRRIYPGIVKIARLVSGNKSQVDDIAQLAAIEVVKSLKTYKGIGSIESWAGRIAYRTAMRNIKKVRKIEHVTTPFEDVVIQTADTPEKALSRRQLFETFLQKMSVIPHKRRIALLLHLAYGYTVSEVSDLTGVSPNTVKDRLKTAFIEFQSILDEDPKLVKNMLEELR